MSRPSRSKNTPMERRHPKSDPHAGRETHSSKSHHGLRIATNHPCTIEYKNMIPTQGGKHIFASHQKNASPCRACAQHTTQKGVNRMKMFRKAVFSSIPTAEVLKKIELALPRNTGIRNKNFLPSMGSHFQLLQPL